MRRGSRLLVEVPCAALVAFVLLLQVSPVLNPPRWDEFIVVHDAHRVAEGQIPYRDFFNFIPPGVFLVLAPALGTATSALTVGRYVSATCMGLTFVVLTLALRRRGWSTVEACLWAATVPVGLYGYWAVPSHHWFAALCAAGFLLALSGADPPTPLRWAMAGAAAGLGGLMVQTVGVALVAASAVFLALAASGRAKACAGWLAGLAAVWVPVLTWLAASGGAPAFARDVILWPARNYNRTGNENAGAALQDVPGRLGDLWRAFEANPSWPRLLVSGSGTILYATILFSALVLLVGASVALGRTLRSRSITGPWAPAAILVTFLCFGLAARGNANWLHLVYLLSVLDPLALAAAGGWTTWPRPLRRAAVALLALLLGAGALFHSRGLWLHAPEAWEWADVDRPIREQAINRFLRAPGRLTPGDTLAAFPEGGEVYLYSAPAAVGYTYFLPLSHGYNTLEDHRVVAEQVSTRLPRYVLITPDLETEYLDSASPLAGVIGSLYTRAGIVGNAVIYERR